MDTSFPPSPQWHQPHSACLCCLSESAGWLLYSLNNSIHILNPFTLKHQGILRNGHTARINAIASRPTKPVNTTNQDSSDASMLDLQTLGADTGGLYLEGGSLPSSNGNSTQQSVDPEPQKALLASCGDDLTVVCWDIPTQRLVASLKKTHQKVVKAVEWTGDGRYIVSGDKGGSVVVWSPFNGQINKKVLPEKPNISCISASPAHPDTVAIGLEGGDILVCQVNISQIAVLRRLHGHTERIQSLSWQVPSGGQGYTLLASGSADQTIRVWDVEKERSVNVFTLPDQDSKMPAHQRLKIWVPVDWTSSGQEVMSCTGRLTRGNVHNRVVYQVMVWHLGGFAFTISMDRKIIAWDIESNQGIAHIDCIGGNVYSLHIGLLDPGRIAMGLGNEAIKIWNTLSLEEPYESIIIDRLQSKVRAVIWHPAEEETICFGLENGKIGVIENTLGLAGGGGQSQQGKQGKRGKQGKPGKGKVYQKQTVLQSYHEGAVTSMMWCSSKVFEAPVPELFDLSLREPAFCIISCGSEGKILVSDPSKPMNKSLDLEVVLQRQNPSWYQSYRVIKGVEAPSRRDVAVHPNEDLMAIGNSDGSVEVFELKYFKLVYVYQGHRKRVNRLKWSYTGTNVGKEMGGVQNTPYLLASGSDDGGLAIHRLDQFSEKALAERRECERRSTAENTGQSSTSSPTSADTNSVVPTTRPFAYTWHHSRGISDLAWSPHGSDEQLGAVSIQKLVTASYDGKSIVYQLRIDDTSDGDAKASQITEVAGIDEAEAAALSERQTTAASSMPKLQAVACFNQHEGQVLSVHWSMSMVNQIYSGGNDWRTCLWDWRSHMLTDAQRESLKSTGSNPGSQSENKSTTSKSSQPATPRKMAQAAQEGLEGASKPNSEIERKQIDATIQLQQPANQDDPCNNTAMLQPVDIAVEVSLAAKRQSDTSLPTDVTPSKRARTSATNPTAATAPPSSGNSQTSHKTTAPVTHIKRVNLFPLSSAAFQVQSKGKVHLEILRLTRNLYCRRLGQGGTLANENELEAARKRWQAMRHFFERDEDEQGMSLSRILGSDIDEMNFQDEDDEEELDAENRAGAVQDEPHGILFRDDFNKGAGQIDNPLQESETLDHQGDENSGKEKAVGGADSQFAGDESTASNGDLIFYGSRESIKALAEMEALEMAKGQSGQQAQAQQHSNIFSVGGGLGVLPAPTHQKAKGQASQARLKSVSQLSQIPVSYWLGDVPKMTDILSALPDTELGVHDWIGIALSPMGGAGAWRDMMARTAAKFESRGEVHAAVLCYLGIGHVFEAVAAYQKRGMYREALMLLRIRLWDDDEDDSVSSGSGLGEGSNRSATTTTDDAPKGLRTLHVQILTEWGQHLERKNLYEQACKCQLTLAAILKRSMERENRGRSISDKAERVFEATPSVGLQTLARRGDLATLRTAAGLAILLNDPSQQERISVYESVMTDKREADRMRKSQQGSV
ncbi:Gem-associated protein 5 [Dissophora ornata]|nr:Gem-associated protein 5 [Dissophora ornata]